MRMTPLTAARLYLKRGWSVIPLQRDSKLPAIPWGEFMKRRPTEAELVSWFGHLDVPPHNVGIVCGEISGLAVVDVDFKNGGLLPHSDIYKAVVKTPNGQHFYCQYEPGLLSRPVEKGIDLKASGGYVVAPPSFVNGVEYLWLGSISLPLPQVPAQYRGPTPTAEAESTYNEPWVANTLLYPEAVSPGTQEPTLARLCWYAALHWPPDIAFSILGTWIERLVLGQPGYKWTLEHVKTKLDAAYAKAPAQVVDAKLVEDVSQIRDKLRSAKQFLSESPPEQDWLIPDFIAPGAFTEIMGVMKEGKSTLICAMLHNLLADEPFLGRPTRRKPVLFLSEQSGLSLQQTLLRGQLAYDDLYVLTLADIFGIPWPKAVAEILRLAHELGVGLVVVDTLARLSMMDEEDEARSVAALNPFLAAKKLGIAVVFVRHCRKSGGPINVAGRGSGAITGEMDICVRIESVPKLGIHQPYRKLEWVSRLGESGEVTLHYADGAFKTLDVEVAA